MRFRMQASPARLMHAEDSQEAQAQLQTSREGAAGATRDKEAALARCAHLEEELSKRKVRISLLTQKAAVLTSPPLPCMAVSLDPLTEASMTGMHIFLVSAPVGWGTVCCRECSSDLGK